MIYLVESVFCIFFTLFLYSRSLPVTLEILTILIFLITFFILRPRSFFLGFFSFDNFHRIYVLVDDLLSFRLFIEQKIRQNICSFIFIFVFYFGNQSIIFDLQFFDFILFILLKSFLKLLLVLLLLRLELFHFCLKLTISFKLTLFL